MNLIFILMLLSVTSILTFSVYFFSIQKPNEGFVWMNARLDRNNTRRYVGVTKLSVGQSNMPSVTSGAYFNWI